MKDSVRNNGCKLLVLLSVLLFFSTYSTRSYAHSTTPQEYLCPVGDRYLVEVDKVYNLLKSNIDGELDYSASKKGVVIRISIGKGKGFWKDVFEIDILIPFILSIPYEIIGNKNNEKLIKEIKSVIPSIRDY